MRIHFICPEREIRIDATIDSPDVFREGVCYALRAMSVSSVADSLEDEK